MRSGISLRVNQAIKDQLDKYSHVMNMQVKLAHEKH
jgi:hypothetical protein